jgi:hypothetical protein
MLFVVVLAFTPCCAFEYQIDWDSLVWQPSDSVDGQADALENGDGEVQLDADPEQDTSDENDQLDVEDEKDQAEAVDAKDSEAEAANPCPEGEYPDPILLKCLKYPCCDLNGSWMMQLLSNSDPLANYNYAVSVQQVSAVVNLQVLGASPTSIPLPNEIGGTLEADSLHFDGGDQATTGFLMMDAKKVEEQLFELGHVAGSYKLIVNGEPTKSGQWTLSPN